MRRLPERLNITQVEYMEKRLAPYVTQSHINVILDLRDVKFMDCRMVGHLISVNRALQDKQSMLTLRNLTEHVKLLSDVLKLNRILNIET